MDCDTYNDSMVRMTCLCIPQFESRSLGRKSFIFTTEMSQFPVQPNSIKAELCMVLHQLGVALIWQWRRLFSAIIFLGAKDYSCGPDF